MRSTQIENMEAATGIPLLKKRWEWKALMLYTIAETIKSKGEPRDATSSETPENYNKVFRYKFREKWKQYYLTVALYLATRT
jgi:hypothetical protein